MADNFRGAPLGDDEDHLDLRPLLRLGGWGGCALAAVVVAVVAGLSDSGERRAGVAFAALTGSASEQSLRLSGAELLARADSERETRRLAEALRSLAGDRDRLANRVAALERNLDDLTGSIKRLPAIPANPAAAAPAPVAAAPATPPVGRKDDAPPAASQQSASLPNTSLPGGPLPRGGLPSVSLPSVSLPSVSLPSLSPASVSPPSTPQPDPPQQSQPTPAPQIAGREPSAPPLAEAAAAPPVAAVPVPRPGPIALIQSYAMSTASPAPSPPAAAAAPVVAAAPPAPAGEPAANEPMTPPATIPSTEFAVDLGAASSVNGLRALWERSKARQPAQLTGLRPLISVRDGARPGSTELRLVAGPLPSAGAAARLCAALTIAGVHCQPAVFDGQRLALR